MFTCLTVTLQKTVGKWHFALILCFLVENRGSQAGVHPISTLRVSMGIPLLSTPIFNSENTKLLLNVVFPLFSVTVTVKQVNKELFPFDLWCFSTSDGKIFFDQKIFFHFFSTFFPLFLLFFPSKTVLFLRKNLKSEKNILFQFFIHVTVFSKMFPHLIWHFQSYLGRKKGTSETFLSLGLFISRPRLQKTFPRFLFSTSVTLEKLKSDIEKFYFRRDMEKN